MPSTPSLSDIGQIALTVSDVATATTFYRDVLGLKFLFSAGPDLAFLAAGSVRIMLSTSDGAATAVGKNSVLYFKTADLAAEHTAVVGRGAKNESDPRLVARMPDHELWLAFVRDPDGNLVGLMQEKPPVGIAGLDPMPMQSGTTCRLPGRSLPAVHAPRCH